MTHLQKLTKHKNLGKHCVNSMCTNIRKRILGQKAQCLLNKGKWQRKEFLLKKHLVISRSILSFRGGSVIFNI